MEEQNAVVVTPRSAGIRYGLIAAAIMIAYFLILTVSGIDSTSGIWSFIRICISIVLLILAHRYYKMNGDGFMSYGQGVGIGFWMGLLSAGIGSVFSYIYVKFIDAGFIEMMKDAQIEKMQEKGMSDEQIDQAMKIASMFMTPEAILGFGIIFGIIGALIIAVIVSIFTQKKNPEPAF